MAPTVLSYRLHFLPCHEGAAALECTCGQASVCQGRPPLGTNSGVGMVSMGRNTGFSLGFLPHLKRHTVGWTRAGGGRISPTAHSLPAAWRSLPRRGRCVGGRGWCQAVTLAGPRPAAGSPGDGPLLCGLLPQWGPCGWALSWPQARRTQGPEVRPGSLPLGLSFSKTPLLLVHDNDLLGHW